MTAANALAMRGHKVSLFEKDGKLGGASRLAASLPRREKFNFIADDEIINCIRCKQACIGRVMQANGMNCVVNPAAGREQRFGKHTWDHVEQARHWVVVGGGPGGMTAANALAMRGHKVSLFEKDGKLGGASRLAASLPRREKFNFIADDLEVQMKKHGVDIRLNTNVNVEMIKDINPDGIVIATGAIAVKNGFTLCPRIDCGQCPGNVRAQGKPV